MNRTLHIDLAALRASRQELDRMAADAADLLTRLRSSLAQAGPCWGSDRPGRTFAQGYEPTCADALRELNELVEVLNQMGHSLTDTANAFNERDITVAEQMRRSVASSDDSTAHVPPPIPPDPDAQPSFAQSQTAETSSEASAPRSDWVLTDPVRPSSTPPVAPESAPGLVDQPAPVPGQPITRPAPDHLPTSAKAPSPVTSVPPAAAADHGPSPSLAARNDRPGRNFATASRANTPWSPPVAPARSPAADTPWHPTHSDPQTSPTNSAPRFTTPRTKDSVTPERPAAAADSRDARPRLSLTGFDPDGTAGEMVEAVEILMERYPIPLRGIEIADLGGGCRSPLVLRRDGQPDTAAGLWLIVDRLTLADGAPCRGRSPRCSEDSVPLSVSLARGFGYAMDMASEYRAHRRVERALIADYLHGAGRAHESLGQAVAGYRQWRSRFSDRCFVGGSLDPGEALAEGFAEFEAHGDQAGAHARLLHRLLIAEWAASPRVGDTHS
ncbi:hypothetical protein ACIBCD_41645 [Nocardia brasiliensis]|uniref:hypothetical protein n=2 Tax=Nocardia brasiliensis TaxID=37326 RepID=UPI0037B31631